MKSLLLSLVLIGFYTVSNAQNSIVFLPIPYVNNHTVVEKFNIQECMDSLCLSGYNKMGYKDNEGALTDFVQEIKLHPQNTCALFGCAQAKSCLLEYSDAIHYYNEVIVMNANVDCAYYGRALAKINLADYWGAIGDFNSALNLDSANATYYYARGLTNITLELKDAGCSDFKKAIDLGSDAAYDKIKVLCR